MHRCSSNGCHGNMVGSCSCGSAFSLYSFASSSSPSYVDCTLSLATPSTRRAFNEKNEKRADEQRRFPNFCWDILSPPPPPSNQPSPSVHKSGENIVPRRCANCDTTSTPLWRNGPRGPKSLCNACGIRFKKEERRATAAAATANGGGIGMDTQHVINTSSWGHHHHHHHMTQTQKMGYELRFVDGDRRDSDATATGGTIPFISWRLNNVAAADRSTLVHDFTR